MLLLLLLLLLPRLELCLCLAWRPVPIRLLQYWRMTRGLPLFFSSSQQAAMPLRGLNAGFRRTELPRIMKAIHEAPTQQPAPWHVTLATQPSLKIPHGRRAALTYDGRVAISNCKKSIRRPFAGQEAHSCLANCVFVVVCCCCCCCVSQSCQGKKQPGTSGLS